MLKQMQYIPKEHITRAHIGLLMKLERVTERELAAKEMLAELADGLLHAWSVGNALVLTRVMLRTGKRELFIEGVVGRDIIKVADEVVEDWKVIAKHYDCEQIGTNGLSPAWHRIAKKTGFRPKSTLYRMEL